MDQLSGMRSDRRRWTWSGNGLLRSGSSPCSARRRFFSISRLPPPLALDRDELKPSGDALAAAPIRKSIQRFARNYHAAGHVPTRPPIFDRHLGRRRARAEGVTASPPRAVQRSSTGSIFPEAKTASTVSSRGMGFA